MADLLLTAAEREFLVRFVRGETRREAARNSGVEPARAAELAQLHIDDLQQLLNEYIADRMMDQVYHNLEWYIGGGASTLEG